MPTEPTVEDVVRQIARAGWQASRTGNGELHPDDIARLAAELQSRLAQTTDQQVREENEQLRKRLIELREENELLQRIIRFGLSVINKHDAELQRLREAGERFLAFASTLRDDMQEYRIYNEAKAVFAPPTEAEKGAGGK